MADIPDDLLELARTLISLRQKPGTQARFKSYPALLQRFDEQLAACDDPALLRQVLDLDSGYYLLAGYRQRTLEKLLTLDRSAETLRLYAMQLLLFGDVDALGEADTDVEARVTELEAEAAALEAQQERRGKG